MPTRLRSRFIGVTIVVLTLLSSAPASGLQPVDLLATELSREAGASYTAIPDDGRIDVVFSYVFSNEATDTEFPGFFESLPVNAIDVSARAGGRTLTVAPLGVVDDVATWFVEFSSPLQPATSLEVTLVWTLTATDEVGELAAPGVVALDVFVPGEGATPLTLDLTVPVGYESIEGLSSEGAADAGDLMATFSTVLPRPYEVQRFHFTNPDLYVVSEVDLPPVVVLTSWPGDPNWADQVGDRAREIAGDLERWFGARSDPFTIQRTFAVDGQHPESTEDFFALTDDSATVIDHQLAHAWLADVAVEEPWFLEGLALGFAGQSGETGTAEAMIARLVGELGTTGVRAVVDALRAESSPYSGPTPETRVQVADWRLLLDLVEEVGGVTDAASGFRTTVVNDEGAAAIDRRAAARIDYAALEVRAGSWSLPRFLRVAMESWEFDTFSERQTEVSDAIATRDSLEAWAEALELERRNDGEALFELATDDLDSLVELQHQKEAALEAFDEAERVVNGDRGLLARVGLWGSDPDQELAELRLRWGRGLDVEVEHDAIELAESVESAVGRGTIRLLVPALFVLAIYLLGRFLWRTLISASPAAEPQP